MLLQLAENLDVPLRERNPLLLAAGYAPTYQATDFEAPEMQSVRDALERLLAAHEPYPAILVDRRWQLVSANLAATVLVDGVDADLLQPPCNVLRASLHPRGLAPRIVNIGQWSAHIIDNLRRQIAVTGDDELRELERELVGYATELGITVPPLDRNGPIDRDAHAPARRRGRNGPHDDDRDLRHRPRHHARRAVAGDVPARGRARPPPRSSLAWKTAAEYGALSPIPDRLSPVRLPPVGGG